MSIKISKITRSTRSTRSTGCMIENRSGVTSHITSRIKSIISFKSKNIKVRIKISLENIEV